MQSLKITRKSKYPKAADFLPVLLDHGVKYSLPEYSLFESGRAIPNRNNAITICKCLGCRLCDIEELRVFAGDRGAQIKPDTEPRMIPGRNISFQDLPKSNPKRSAGRWSDGNWIEIQYKISEMGYDSMRAFYKGLINGDIVSVN